MKSLDAGFIRMAHKSNWTDVSVSYRFSQEYSENIKFTAGGWIFLGVIGCLVLVSIVGTIVEAT